MCPDYPDDVFGFTPKGQQRTKGCLSLATRPALYGQSKEVRWQQPQLTAKGAEPDRGSTVKPAISR